MIRLLCVLWLFCLWLYGAQFNSPRPVPLPVVRATPKVWKLYTGRWAFAVVRFA